jgi:hypothetical protein
MNEDVVTLAIELTREARYDLRVARILFEYINRERYDEGDLYYFGRRILYFLQQASEKALKACILIFFVYWSKIVTNVVGEIDRNKFPNIYKIYKIAKLTPRGIGHEVHKRYLNIMRDLYHLACTHRRETEQYLRLFLEGFDKHIKLSISKNSYFTDEEKKIIISTLERLMKALREGILSSFATIKCDKLQIEHVSSESLPPSYIGQTLEAFLKLESNIDEQFKPIESNLMEAMRGKIDEYRPFIVEIIPGVNVQSIERLIEKKLDYVVANLKVWLLYPVAFLPLYMCLYWYESGGRYPDKVAKVGIDSVLKDIDHLKNVVKTVSDIVITLSDAITTLYYE